MQSRWMRLFAVLCLSLSGLAAAHDYSCAPPLLQVGAGVFNIRKHRNRQPMASVEYKWSPVVYTVRPLVGLMMTTRGSGYVYGGAGIDLFITRHVVFTPSFAPGLYWRGNGKEMGCPLEFRSSIELAGILSNDFRIGAQFYHISNASIGWKNPGTECLLLFVSIPLTAKE